MDYLLPARPESVVLNIKSACPLILIGLNIFLAIITLSLSLSSAHYKNSAKNPFILQSFQVEAEDKSAPKKSWFPLHPYGETALWLVLACIAHNPSCRQVSSEAKKSQFLLHPHGEATPGMCHYTSTFRMLSALVSLSTFLFGNLVVLILPLKTQKPKKQGRRNKMDQITATQTHFKGTDICLSKLLYVTIYT